MCLVFDIIFSFSLPNLQQYLHFFISVLKCHLYLCPCVCSYCDVEQKLAYRWKQILTMGNLVFFNYKNIWGASQCLLLIMSIFIFKNLCLLKKYIYLKFPRSKLKWIWFSFSITWFLLISPLNVHIRVYFSRLLFDPR